MADSNELTIFLLLHSINYSCKKFYSLGLQSQFSYLASCIFSIVSFDSLRVNIIKLFLVDINASEKIASAFAFLMYFQPGVMRAVNARSL